METVVRVAAGTRQRNDAPLRAAVVGALFDGDGDRAAALRARAGEA